MPRVGKSPCSRGRKKQRRVEANKLEFMSEPTKQVTTGCRRMVGVLSLQGRTTRRLSQPKSFAAHADSIHWKQSLRHQNLTQLCDVACYELSGLVADAHPWVLTASTASARSAARSASETKAFAWSSLSAVKHTSRQP